MRGDMVHSALIFDPSPAIGSCHAATIVELADGDLMAAWFGGTHEGHADVAIWLARFDGDRWLAPVKIVDEADVPLWNPVLFRDSSDRVWLFYKAGPTIPAWSGVFIRSEDDGHTWSQPTLMPAGLLGPAKNKPITLSNGDILSPTSSETWQNWTSWVEISPDRGETWSRHGPITAPGFGAGGDRSDRISAEWDNANRRLHLPQSHRGLIQPAVWEYAPGRLRMLMRATRSVGAVCMADSQDYGWTWAPAHPIDILNPNSGLDAACLPDGRIALVCNPVSQGRTPLSLLFSADNGETWPERMELETGSGEFSYPSVIGAKDGRLHVVYTYDRRSIKHQIIEAP